MDISKFIQNKGLTEIEIEVLNYMIDNINDINKMGVRGVAKNNFTSTSTIMRLAKNLVILVFRNAIQFIIFN